MIKQLIEKIYWRFIERDRVYEGMEDVEVEQVFKSLSLEDDLKRVLRALLKGDKARYFIANNDEQRAIIRGEYSRSLFLIKKLSQKEKRSPMKIGGRYG